VYAVADRAGGCAGTVQILALALIAFGVLLPGQSIAAAPLLVAYAIWPARLEWKRPRSMFIPALGRGLWTGFTWSSYEILHVKREIRCIALVFDLGGITHFAKENQFPVTWNGDETALLVRPMLRTHHWDSYWTLDPCNS